MEVASGDEAGLLEDRGDVLARRAGEACGLEDHELAGLQHAGSVWAALRRGPRSGSRLAVSGVGTQISTASQRANGWACVDAEMRPLTACRRSDVMSSMYDVPLRRLSILVGSVSNPSTSWPSWPAPPRAAPT